MKSLTVAIFFGLLLGQISPNKSNLEKVKTNNNSADYFALFNKSFKFKI